MQKETMVQGAGLGLVPPLGMCIAVWGKISVLLQELRPPSRWGMVISGWAQPMDPRLLGTRRLLIEISGTPPCYFSSVQFSSSVVSDSLWPHESQHARPPCPSPSPGVHSDSRPSSPWCHPAISSSAVPFFSCPQSLPASKSKYNCNLSTLTHLF